MGDINIHRDSPELPLAERFNNFLKPLDFVTMTCIQPFFLVLGYVIYLEPCLGNKHESSPSFTLSLIAISFPVFHNT